jgi:hypothetical protein
MSEDFKKKFDNYISHMKIYNKKYEKISAKSEKYKEKISKLLCKVIELEGDESHINMWKELTDEDNNAFYELLNQKENTEINDQFYESKKSIDWLYEHLGEASHYMDNC